MAMAAKKELFREVLKRYLKASLLQKKTILDELSASSSMHRKSVIRALRRKRNKDPWKEQGKAGRPLMYGADVVTGLKELWEISGELCAERLHTIITEYVNILVRDDMRPHSDEVTFKLLRSTRDNREPRTALLR